MSPARSIDLHGYTREKALRQLTETLELCLKRNEVHLNVVTGVGQHSEKGGAVLRPSVQKYLDERRFRYKYQTGCFEIEVSSGELRYAHKTTAPSTKLLHAASLPSQISLPNGTQNNKMQRAASLPDDFSNGPTPEEVAQDETALEQGKRQSLQEYQELQKEIRREKQAIDRALELSAHDDYSTSDENEDRLLQAILERSKIDHESESEQRINQEEDLLQQAISMSMNDYTESSTEYRDEDILFRKILEQSAIQVQEEEEDEFLRRAIELSLYEAESCPTKIVSETTKNG